MVCFVFISNFQAGRGQRWCGGHGQHERRPRSLDICWIWPLPPLALSSSVDLHGSMPKVTWDQWLSCLLEASLKSIETLETCAPTHPGLQAPCEGFQARHDVCLLLGNYSFPPKLCWVELETDHQGWQPLLLHRVSQNVSLQTHSEHLLILPHRAPSEKRTSPATSDSGLWFYVYHSWSFKVHLSLNITEYKCLLSITQWWSRLRDAGPFTQGSISVASLLSLLSS